MLASAPSCFGTIPRAHIYLDAGDAGWLTPEQIVEPLVPIRHRRRLGLRAQRRELLHHRRNRSLTDSKLSALLKGKHFVIDTSRNGNGAPPGGAGRQQVVQSARPSARSRSDDGHRGPPRSTRSCGSSTRGSRMAPAGPASRRRGRGGRLTRCRWSATRTTSARSQPAPTRRCDKLLELTHLGTKLTTAHGRAIRSTIRVSGDRYARLRGSRDRKQSLVGGLCWARPASRPARHRGPAPRRDDAHTACVMRRRSPDWLGEGALGEPDPGVREAARVCGGPGPSVARGAAAAGEAPPASARQRGDRRF